MASPPDCEFPVQIQRRGAAAVKAAKTCRGLPKVAATPRIWSQGWFSTRGYAEQNGREKWPRKMAEKKE